MLPSQCWLVYDNPNIEIVADVSLLPRLPGTFLEQRPDCLAEFSYLLIEHGCFENGKNNSILEAHIYQILRPGFTDMTNRTVYRI